MQLDPETTYLLTERSGFLIDAGLTIQEADKEAYRQIFGCEPDENFTLTVSKKENK